MEIWQQGFYDWTIRDVNDWRTKIEYIRMNPVRVKLVKKPQDWPYSSGAGQFTLDPMPSKYSQRASAPEARCEYLLGIGSRVNWPANIRSGLQGLKPKSHRLQRR